MSTPFQLPDLDPDDPRAVSQQIANALRSAILRGQVGPGEKLPSQNALVDRYRVARETIKSALRILDREQLIVSRQGSGSFVRSRLSTTPDVTEFLAGAYDRPQVTIDYAGWRGETLSKTLPGTGQALRVFHGVTSLRIRLLLTDPRASPGLPLPIEPGTEPAAVRPALVRLTDRAISQIRRTVDEFVETGLVQQGEVQVRVHGLGPVIKIYTINDERSLVGFYPVTDHAIDIDGTDVRYHHPSGWEAGVFDDSDRNQLPSFASQARAWFASLWNTIGREYVPEPDRMQSS